MTKDTPVCFSTNGFFEVRAMPEKGCIRLEFVCDKPLEIPLGMIDGFISDVIRAKLRLSLPPLP